jgi:hypothetical protein
LFSTDASVTTTLLQDDDVGMGTLRLQVRAVVQLAVPLLIMMLSF